ncbi:MAG: beta-ketoacyl-ACP synthase [Candidatus Accumulibacter sp.]|jgi:3-oxoacyl-[acyl-carrier-protein] synthase II|uniref:Beta-ketoacyl-ACP synthase n=1 Tax=Candidatus Accumulibacter affinis TaxID=2954384 RepID=A0A935W4X3_9PROT|nr:beta-ketoacyl-ACP synthase [Candidatus Accumulibacter affinis]MBP9804961.1 beta-ketoacyl-ACP synthase [Accumulibacter sp.]
MKRVVVTGMAGITALGDSWAKIESKLRSRRNAVRRMSEWDYFDTLNTRLGAPIDDFQMPANYPRKMIRSMGRVSLLSVRASEMALIDAGLLDDPAVRNGRTGIAYGSSSGSVDPVRIFGRMLESGSLQGVTSTSYIQMMPHTTAVNVGLFFGLRGRVIPTSSACTSGSQGIGYAYEAIRFDRQTIMLAGGAEEISAPGAAVFDTLFATSCRNESPETTPRPFDRDRDGLVIGEGAATLVLEDYEHARARGATIYAEIVGFATNSDGSHITQPESATMAVVMQQALHDAKLPPSAVGYVSAHGTATDRGDIAESRATVSVLGAGKPISSMKSYLGHTLGACGAIEAWWSIEMMRREWFAPTINLDNLDPACGDLDYLDGTGQKIDTEYVMSNNFAFGGINTSLILRRL